MRAKRITMIATAAATAAAAIAAAPVAMAATQTGAARAGAASASPQAEPAFACPVGKGILCVHLQDTSGRYHWYQYSKCVKVTFPSGWNATWYVNNQTPGTKATFYYDIPDVPSGVTWQTPPAKSGGDVNGSLLYGKYYPREVKPC